ncbi:MAG: tryptophan--tRNA ligase, partial [Oscillospiraceae bacterium]
MDNMDKKIVFSGIQPTGVPTLGNYIGAIRNWGKLQEEYNCIFCVVDMHAITVRQDPAKLRKQTLDMYALLLACGIDPQKSILFIQSHVKEHAQLNWVLSCYSQFGELSRMTQFKDKSVKNADNINAGLFTYPTLMAADILLYKTDLVPVGVDQRQHLELARDIAIRFNGVHGDTFVVPEGYIPQVGAKVMSLADPTKKMSKSDENVNGYISILDDEATIVRKFKRAVTDSGSIVEYAEGKDGINNLIDIYSIFTGKTRDEIKQEFEGKGYGCFKEQVGVTVANALKPIRERFNEIRNDKEFLEKCYKEGAERASKLACRTMSKVYKKVGFV